MDIDFLQVIPYNKGLKRSNLKSDVHKKKRGIHMLKMKVCSACSYRKYCSIQNCFPCQYAEKASRRRSGVNDKECGEFYQSHYL